MIHPAFKLQNPALLLATGWIDNEAAKPSSGIAPFPCYDPATDEIWIHVEAFNSKDTEMAIAAAHAAFPSYAATLPRSRARWLLDWERLIVQNKEDLSRIIVMESGKSLIEAQAEIDYACKSSNHRGLKYRC